MTIWGKVLTKPTISTLVVIVFAFGLTILTFSEPAFAQSSTNISGILTTNTVWTKSFSPYSFTGSVTVSSGVSLTIEPGVTVNLNGYPLTVNGVLNATGTHMAKIYINNIDSSNGVFAGLNSILANCVYKGTLTLSGSAKISNSTITGTIRVSGGTVTISNNTIPNTQRIFDGIDFVEAQTITPGYGAYAFIADNTISGCWRGIAINAGNTAVIQRNYIHDNSWGIVNGPNSWEVTAGANATILNNTITRNVGGIIIMGNFSPIVAFNNLQSNNESSVSTAATSSDGLTARTTCPLDVNAAYNYWGTTDQQAINQIIRDHKNYALSGNVYYQPILSSLNPQAMPVQPPLQQPVPFTPLPAVTPTPTPKPTSSPTPTTVQTFAFAAIQPNPTTIGNTISINITITPPPPRNSRFLNVTATVKAPDGTSQVLGPFYSDANGSVQIAFFPTQFGTYTVIPRYSGGFFSDSQATYLPSTSTSTFTVTSPTPQTPTPNPTPTPIEITPNPTPPNTSESPSPIQNSPQITEIPTATETPFPTEPQNSPTLINQQGNGVSSPSHITSAATIVAVFIAATAIVCVLVLVAKLRLKSH